MPDWFRARFAAPGAPPLTRGAAGMLALQLAGLAAAYGVQVALARWMGVAAYGAYTYALAWAATAALLVGLGLPSAAVRFVPMYRAEGDAAHLRGFLRGTTALTLALGLIVALGATGVVLLLDVGEGRAWWLLGAWMVPLLAVFSLRVEVLRAAHRTGWAYAPSLVARPLLTFAGAYLFFRRAGAVTTAEALAVAVAALAVLVAVQTLGLRRGLPSAYVRATPRRYALRGWLRTSLPMLLTGVFIFTVSQADVLMLGALRDVEAVGLYRVAARVAALVTFALVAVNRVAAPRIAALEGDRAALQRFLRTAAHLSFWPSLVVAVAVFAFAEPLLGVFGPDFRSATLALRILALGHLINAATGPAGYVLDLTGHQDQTARAAGFTALLNVILNGIGIPFFGLAGAAVATALTLALRALWLYALARRHLGVRASVFDAHRPPRR